MSDFASLGLSAIMLKSLERLNFSDATPIQAAAIPFALQGRDVLGTAQTGTGKTAAFGIPLIEHVAAEPRERTALVITPTRELAGQVQKALESFVDKAQKIRTALIIGGEPYFKQNKALQMNPAIIIGTPGRLNDHVEQGTLDLSGVTYLVLDETDRMLDMGFSVQIDALLRSMTAERQTMLFSATLPPKIEGLAKTYLKNPERVSMGNQSVPAPDITQETMFLNQGEKLHAMLKIFEEREGTAVVFVRTKFGTERMAKSLSAEGVQAEALHGDLRQRKRDNVVTAFRREKFRVLVATDVAARGLDISHVAMVINHDLPQVAEDYVHRIGRTARAGAKGEAISFVSPQEKGLWAAITRMLNPKAKGDFGDDSYENRPKRGGKFSGKPGGKGFGRGKPRDDWSPEGRPRKPRGDGDWKSSASKPRGDFDDRRGPPRDGERRGPPRDGERRGPPRDGERRGPPRDGERRGPPRDGERRGPPRDGERRGPPRDGERRGPPRDGERRGPPRGDRPGGGRDDWKSGGDRPKRPFNRDRDGGRSDDRGERRNDWKPSGDRPKRPFDRDRPRGDRDDANAGNRPFSKPKGKSDGPKAKDRHRDRETNKDKGKPKWSDKAGGKSNAKSRQRDPE